MSSRGARHSRAAETRRDLDQQPVEPIAAPAAASKGSNGCAVAIGGAVVLLVLTALTAISALNQSMEGVDDMFGAIAGPPGSVSPAAEEEARQFWICSGSDFSPGTWARDALAESTAPALQLLDERLATARSEEQRLEVVAQIHEWCDTRRRLPTTTSSTP